MREILGKLKKVTLILSFLTITSCASVSLADYQNITLNENKKVESIKFTHKLSSPENIKTCIQENVTNNDMPIKNSVGLWAVMTIFVLMPDEQSKIHGGDVIISDKADAIQAAGNIELERTINGRNFLMFILTAKNTSDGQTELLFNNPSIVLEDTGAGNNLGAFPLGSHSLSIFEKNYNGLQQLSNRIGSCLTSKQSKDALS